MPLPNAKVVFAAERKIVIRSMSTGILKVGDEKLRECDGR